MAPPEVAISLSSWMTSLVTFHINAAWAKPGSSSFFFVFLSVMALFFLLRAEFFLTAAQRADIRLAFDAIDVGA